MCFSDNYDWTAQCVHEAYEPTLQRRVCCECRCHIPAGEWCHYLWMQEREECRDCEFEDEPCANDKHDYGETYEGWTCAECQLLREAIKEVEEDEGCFGYGSQPAVGEMYESVDDWGHYREKMLSLGLDEAAHWTPADDDDWLPMGELAATWDDLGGEA